ncbi:MAG: hypothetical protein K1X53_01375 [Candidatus Sumerlaeaceae bacterium]|nr:hypothetical protein [Candidatus Sumerlaeaceae bacterium]
MDRNLRTAALILAVVIGSLPFGTFAEVASSAGPENGGVQLRLMIAPIAEPGRNHFDVQVDLINATTQPVTVSANWEDDRDTGGFADYLESATSVETWPAIEAWSGQTMAPHRTLPQPTQTLEPGKSVSAKWQTKDGRLKRKVSNPLYVQNPDFPSPGLYSVHAQLRLQKARELLLLRSNEQLVSIGGSRAMPKDAIARVLSVDDKMATGMINLGSLNRIEPGDMFRVRTGMMDFWTFIVRDVETERSVGVFEVMQMIGRNRTSASPAPVQAGDSGALMPRRVELLSPVGPIKPWGLAIN